MGSYTSKPESTIVVGVPPSSCEPADLIEAQFTQLYYTMTQPTSQDIRDYINTFRQSTKEPYDLKAEVENAKMFGIENARHKIINILIAYTRKIDNIANIIDQDCGTIHGFCPKHVLDAKTHAIRSISSLDQLQPCQERTCMKRQLREQLAKYKRWIINMKWAGDQGKSSTVVEDREIGLRELIEILESLQKLPLRMIEEVTTPPVAKCTGAGTFPAVANIFPQFITRKFIFAMIIILILLLCFIALTDRPIFPFGRAYLFPMEKEQKSHTL